MPRFTSSRETPYSRPVLPNGNAGLCYYNRVVNSGKAFGCAANPAECTSLEGNVVAAGAGRCMGKIPDNLRRIIAANIRACRMRKFPGRGGGKKCAETFGVSPQQWSPWERGMRTPDETRLEQIAQFFNVTVEYMRRDNHPPVPGAPPCGPAFQPISGLDATGTLLEKKPIAPAVEASETSPYAGMAAPELFGAMHRDRIKAVYQVEVSVTSVRFMRCDEPDGSGGCS